MAPSGKALLIPGSLGCAQTDTNLTDITDGLLFEFPGSRWWGKTPENAADWQDFSWFTNRVMLH